MSDSFLLFDEQAKEQISERLLPLFVDQILLKAWDTKSPAEFPSQSRVYAYVSDRHAPDVIEAAIKGDWILAILPYEGAIYARRGFCIEENLEKALLEAQLATSKKVDVLRCNGKVVLSTVVLGECFNLLPTAKSLSWRDRMSLAWKNITKIRAIRPQKMSFTTENESCFSTALIGLVIIEHAHGSSLSRNILPDTHINDGMCHSMLVAPRSVVEMLRFFVMAPFSRTVNLPNFLGLLKTKSFSVVNGKALTYTVDGQLHQADQLTLDTQSRVLNLLVGPALPIVDTSPSHKEQRKISRLPAGEAITAMVSKELPFVAHAATEEFKDLYQLLRENAKTSNSFLTLMVLSTLLASVGLFANSAPVIIGAMILAPLMAPIISFSMGLVRQDNSLLICSIKTLLIGLFLSLGFAATASFIMPMETITPEIAARLSPSLLDLAVAVISGIAGAYAHARVEAAKSMAGVAIAVALVPPLAVMGIGLGWLDFHVTRGALLLFLTNLAGIALAASLTFLALGFAPFTRAKKGLSIALLGVAIVSIPLVFSFIRLSDESSIIQQLQGKQIGEVTLRQVHANAIKPLALSVELVTPSALTTANIDFIKDNIEQQLQREVILEANIVIRR
ncbi:TIGR00341 family protein [Psychromonas sp. psych-6C06]|uniref:TIGR00341 family protein n=1 Tax=Psychromonas sp. psych-6C06 TaxID=2058089 RepID=UPI000C32D6A9|nr:TIGR00341 family protein [Psychromonas sp. psych-6C06]PKF60418.1 TIGR00341 family protein [Psychromonas sp. psych-6C06]